MNIRMSLMASAIAVVLLMSGCFGNFQRGADVSGTVKIVEQVPKDLGPTYQPGSPRTPIASPQSAFLYTEPTFEYIVYLKDPSIENHFILAGSSLGFEHVRTVYPGGYYVVYDTEHRSSFEALWLLHSLEYVSLAEENGRVQPVSFVDDGTSRSWQFDASEHWPSNHIRADMARRIAGEGDEDIVVAVIDTGIDFHHPAFGSAGDIWVQGLDFISTEGPEAVAYGPSTGAGKESAHGTKVAGIIAARQATGASMKGVAPAVRIMPIRVLFGTSKEIATEETIARAVNWAVDSGANVINLSLGIRNKTECSTVLKRALDEAWEADVTVVAAAGNDRTVGVICPASHDKVISVGASVATTPVDGLPATYSAAGDRLDLLAPGGIQQATDCYSGVMGPIPGSYGRHPYDCSLAGTSFAAPHVAGVAALMLSYGNAVFPDDIKHLLQMTARPLSTRLGHDPWTGYGLLDAGLAVSARTPKVFIAKKTGERLSMTGHVNHPGEGGSYRLTGLPDGHWMLVGWSDVDESGTVSPGDYYAELPIHLIKGQRYLGVDLLLTPYDGAPLTVDYER